MSTLEAVTSELEREPHLWWGHHHKHGWVVLDRQDNCNEGESRKLTRCRDWNQLTVSRQEFGSAPFVWFKTYIASLPAAKVRETCDQLLALRREYDARDARLSLKRNGWLTCKSPHLMLAQLDVRSSVRKLQLFGIACCRRIWQFLEEDCRQAILMAEGFVEGTADLTQCRQAQMDLRHKRLSLQREEITTRERTVRLWCLLAVVNALQSPEELQAALRDSAYHPDALSIWKFVELAVHAKQYNDPPTPEMLEDRAAQADILREILGHPFRPPPFQPDWETPTVLALAQAIYAEQAFEQLPILADALEDAGCDNLELLGHLRETREHVRGCWALDLILSKDC